MMYESFGNDIKRADHKILVFFLVTDGEVMLWKSLFSEVYVLLAEIVNFVGNCVLKSIHKSLSPCAACFILLSFVRQYYALRETGLRKFKP